MRILVPVKQAARPVGESVLDSSGALDPAALTWELGEWDSFAVEAALALAEAEPDADAEVLVVTVAPERAEQALRTCLAMGADRAIRIWEEGLEEPDPLAVACVLAAHARIEEPELIVCGVQSSDAANGATAAALAGLLGLPRVAAVSAIAREQERLLVDRELEGGAVEVLRLAYPALLSVQSAANAPRRPNLRAIKQARSMPLDVLALSDLELDATALRAASGSRRVRLLERAPARGASMIDGPASAIAERIAEIVAEALRA